MRRLLLVLVLSLLILLSLTIGWFSYRFFRLPITNHPQSLHFEVPPGVTLSELVFSLQQQGIIKDPYFFLIMAKLTAEPLKLKAGEYALPPRATPQLLLKKLKSGAVMLDKITLVEGWTFQQVMQAIDANPALLHTLSGKDPATIMQMLGHATEHPEGRFYPDTYLFAPGTKDSKILHMAYDLMQKKLQQAWQTRANNLPYQQPYQALVVASMIEKESAKVSERPLIAGVILHRLQIGMRLQIDATVIYGLGSAYQGNITHQDLLMDTPYNTYTRAGLPPTPIAMPSKTAIWAALHPDQGPALYYVAKGDGSHIFSNTLTAHHQAIEKYLLPKNRLLAAQSAHSVSGSLLLNYWKFLGSDTICTPMSNPLI